MGSAISSSNKDYVNSNWDKLKCSPIGPFLQMIGVAPGDVNSTSNICKSSEFSSQFNSSMSDQLNVTKGLSKGMGAINGTMDKFRKVIANIQQKAFEDLSKIAKMIFNIYVKIGNIFFLIIKHLSNILKIFKETVNFGSSIAVMLIAFINLLRAPVNGMINFVRMFKR